MTRTNEEEKKYSKIDHTHCWQSDNPPCGLKGKHRCCLCELPNEPLPDPQQEKCTCDEPRSAGGKCVGCGLKSESNGSTGTSGEESSIEWEKGFLDWLHSSASENKGVKMVYGRSEEELLAYIRIIEREAREAERRRIVGILKGLKSDIPRAVDGLGRPKSPTEIIIIAECRGRNHGLSDAITSRDK